MKLVSRAMLLFFSGILPMAADFVPPAEGPLPFRRDKLPLDADTMSALSRQLAGMAAAAAAKEPGELRALAQMTALALALDPENRAARELIASMRSGGEPAAAAAGAATPHRAWQLLAWLEMPEAGADGQALAACLGDVLARADAGHPKARARRAAGEQGAWQDWVAAEAAFAPAEEPEESAPETSEPTEEMTAEEKPSEPVKTLALRDLELEMPIWHFDRQSQKMVLGQVAVQMHARIRAGKDGEDDVGGPTFRVAGEDLGQRLSPSLRQVENALASRHGTLPKGLSFTLGFDKAGYPIARNGQALSGTAALLAEGALSGAIPTASALAVVGEDGKLELPPRFWQTLRALSALPAGGRLILPDQAAEYLTALVVLDDAAFFMKNEVLLAGSVDEIWNLAAASPEAEVADGLKRFDEIRKVGQDKPLGTFVAHPATQQRLRELVALMPEHASARLLALQGSGSRPRFLQRSILAREIRSALEPVGYVTERNPNGLDPGRLETLREASREKLERLAGYIDIRDRDLHKAALDTTDSLRTLIRLLPKKDPDNPVGQMKKQFEAYQESYRRYIRVMQELTAAAGDAEDFPPPQLPDDE
jgi:hypothetical protein